MIAADAAPKDWERDYQCCLRGMHGRWWKLRAERARTLHQTFWRVWRDIRMFEEPPDDGVLLRKVE